MLKAFKYRIYPTNEQSVLINKHIGSCRFVYNLALECKQTAYISNRTNLSGFELINQLPDLKKECIWLKEINSQSLQQSIINLEKAFTNFFKGQNKYPNFKKKSARQSFNIPANVELIENKVCFPKFKKGVKIVLHRPVKGVIKQATISKTSTEKYFISILCETNEKLQEKSIPTENKTIGIDLGLKSFLVTSNGETFDNPRFLKKSQSKLKYIQSKFSKHKGKRTKLKLASLHEKIANQRKNFLQTTSTKLIRDNQSIAIEDLNIIDMYKNHTLSKSVSDVGWGMFIDMLKYKADWYGNNILQIGRFEPSSKTCSRCGNFNKKLALSDREWICDKCGANHDRDLNASVNIKNFALKNYLSAEHRHENQNELPTMVGVLTSEVIKR